MEYLKPHELCNRYFDARAELRQCSTIETVLIERIGELPEDDYCHHARESMQLGAGYALIAHQEGCVGYVTDMQHVFAAYFAVQPQNRYLSEEAYRHQQLTTIEAAMKHLEDIQLEPHEDPHDAAALAAFFEGYSIASNSLHNKAPIEPALDTSV